MFLELSGVTRAGYAITAQRRLCSHSWKCASASSIGDWYGPVVQPSSYSARRRVHALAQELSSIAAPGSGLLCLDDSR